VGLIGAGELAVETISTGLVEYSAAVSLGCGVWYLATHREERAKNWIESPDWHLADVVHYIVNDSLAVLEENPPPGIAPVGFGRTAEVTFRGRPEADAVRQIQQQLVFGNLRAWGRHWRGVGHTTEIWSTISEDYWKTHQLHELYARIREADTVQTVANQANDGAPEYADLKFPASQVKRIWKPKSLLRRFWERTVRRLPRHTDGWSR
jgi:hypothetical protein